MTGTLINAGAVVAGSLIGMAVRSRLPQRFVDIAFQAIGLVTLLIGISMGIRTTRLILVVCSVVLGALCGEAMRLERGLERLSERLRSRVRLSGERFAEGFVTATMLFCVGSLSILGPIREGTGGGSDLLVTKSVMDLISSLILASTFGASILFSALSVLLYQGAVTLCAASLSRLMTESMIAEMTAVGGVLLVGLGISILGIRKIPVTNMLPALVFAVLLGYFFA